MSDAGDTPRNGLAQSLQGRTIALPETRNLDLLAGLLERRGARTLRCPLVSIHDAPDPAPVEAWLRRTADGQHDVLILLTGEGVRRLLDCAERNHLREPVIAGFARAQKVTRGPKPARALKDLGLATDLAAPEPTTTGVIATLRERDLRDRTVGVQLYGTDPNRPLTEFLTEAGARIDTVAPYVYADAAEDAQVVTLIRELAEGAVDAITFTSSPQIRRLWTVARRHECLDMLEAGLRRTCVAAVGPLVGDALRERGVRVDVMPATHYFMKPLVQGLVAALGPQRPI